MAAIGTPLLTLLDWAKRVDPDGNIPLIANLLTQTNQILQDMLWKEGNMVAGESLTVTTALPKSYFRLLNQFLPATKGKTAQIQEQCALLEAYGNIDQAVMELNGTSSAFRLTENAMHLESMNQTFANQLIYGDSLTPEAFVGLEPRYAKLGSTGTGPNLINANGNTANGQASILLVGWGANSVYGIFPKGSTAGLKHEDLGIQSVYDANGQIMRAYQDHWVWKGGIALKDWRYVVRACNIDVAALLADPTGGTINLINLMLGMLHHLPTTEGGMVGNSENGTYVGIKPVFYMNRTLRKMLDIQAQNKANLLLHVEQEEGKYKTMLREAPIRLVDAMTTTEAVVS